MSTKYCIRQDDDCHWYLIPVDSKKYFDDLIDKGWEEFSDEDWDFLDKTKIDGYHEVEFYLG